MARFLGRPDQTQEELLPFLAVTERLLVEACGEAGECGGAEIIALPDLGMPHNAARIHGGFLTGAFYTWECSTPFVPVDATVNLCGVAVFRLDGESGVIHDFAGAVERAKGAWAERTPYLWNFTTGNHFVILACDAHGQHYLILHASPAEFKANYPGLYPNDGSWFAHSVRTHRATDGSSRYLRYLAGSPAVRFYERAQWLLSYQKDRMRSAAELIAGRRHVDTEVFNDTHYGMKTTNSIGIGCYVFDAVGENASRLYPLLTRPKAPIPLVIADAASTATVTLANRDYVLAPHGLGVRSTRELGLVVGGERLQAWGREHERGLSLGAEPEMAIREYHGLETVNRVLAQCPGVLVHELTQTASIYRGSELRD